MLVPLVGVLALLAVIIFVSYFDSIAQYALESASSSIPGRLQVKKFLPTMSGVQMQGVRWDLDEKDPFFVADRVDVTIDHKALLRRDWLVLIRHAMVIKPGLRVTVAPDGTLNLMKLLESDEEPSKLDITQLRVVLEWKEGWVLYNDRRDAGFLYELSDWKGSAAFPDGEILLLKTDAHRKEDSSKFSFEGEVSLLRPRLSTTLNLARVDLLPFAGFPGFGPGLTLVQGMVNGSIVVQGSGETWDDVLASVFAVGKVELSDGLLASPLLPVDLKGLNGKVSLLGREVSTSGFQGLAAGIPFRLEGTADLDPEGEVTARLAVARFSLELLKPYLQNPPPVSGEAEVDVDVEGPVVDPNISGLARAYNLHYQDQVVPKASSRFLKTGEIVYLSEVQAETAAGKVTGEGWLFLGEKPRILFALQGQGTNPSALMPDLAESADFRVRVLGTLDDPMLYGQGELRGLGSWGQGISSAGGQFYFKGQELMLLDGLAFKGGSSVRVPVASVNIESRQVDGIVRTDGFSLADVPGLQGVSGYVSGEAVVSADLSGSTPQIVAQGQLTDGTFSSGGLTASSASGAFAFDGAQMIIPDASASVEGGRVNLAGVFDTRNNGLAFSARADGMNLAALGLPGESASMIGSISGQLGGQLGVYGYAESARGKAALSGFQRANGTLGAVAWVDAPIPGQEDSNMQATVVAGGTLDRMNLEYNGQAQAPVLSSVGPLDVMGSATLADKVLTVHPTLVAARDENGNAEPARYLTYSGEAYPFFGPLLAGPLKQVVVEEQAVPTRRSLSLAGKADLARESLDFRFQLRSAGLQELADQPLGSDPDSASLNETLPFDVLSGFGSVQGILSGTFRAPRLQADYDVPWLLLANGYENRHVLSSKGRVSMNGPALNIDAAAVSETPFDGRLTGAPKALYNLASQMTGMLAARGKVEASGRFDLRLATAGFDASFLSLVAPSTYLSYLPYGRLATENLHIWGTATSPSLAGAVRLLQGGLYMAGESFPFQVASLDFNSEGGKTRIDNLVVQAPGLNVSGYGQRDANGDLSGEISARDIDLAELRRLGPPLSGLGGRADAALALEGNWPRQPRIEVALNGRDLTWNPAAVGGMAATLPIEELALGHFGEDGQTLASGLTITQDDIGLRMELPSQGLRFRTVANGLSLEAEGAVRFPGGLPDLRMFKTFSDWKGYFISANGPDLGAPGAPFRASMQNMTFAELARYMGTTAPPYRAKTSAAVALEGQWWRDHKREATGNLPSYQLDLQELTFEGDRGGKASGFDLQESAHLAYQRQGDAGYLTLENLGLGFFSGPSPLGSSVGAVAGNLVARPLAQATPDPTPGAEVSSRQGSLQAEAKLALTQLPEAKPNSSFHLGAVDIPLGNLAFLLPEAITLDGLVESIEVNLDGLLPAPRLDATALVTNLAVGPLREMALRGRLTGQAEGENGYTLSLGDLADPAVTLTFGKADAADHRLQAEGTATLLWRRVLPLNPDRLGLFANGLEVDSNSPIDLASQVVDKNLRIIADAVPGEEQARGDLTASLAVDGTLGYPEFEGKANLANGQFRSRRYGNFENLQLDAQVERISRDEAEPSEVLDAQSSGFLTRFSLPKFDGTLGGKPFFASGKTEFAGLAPTYLNMNFVGEALPVQLPDLFTGTADVDMELRGRMNRVDGKPALSPVILGTIVIPKGDFELPLSAVSSGGEGGLALPLDYDITLDLGQEFFVRLLDSSVRAVGELRVISKDGKPEVYGRTELSRGLIRIPFYDASFRIRQGVAYFEGPMIPRLEAVEAIADLGSYRIVARVEGTYPDKLSVQLFSDPPLPQSELSRLVVLGGLPGQFSGVNDPNQGGSSLSALSGTGVSFLSGMLTNRLTEQLGRVLLLSEVSFDYIPPASYVIKLAKAIDPNDTFLLTLTRVIRDNGINEQLYGVEWRLSPTFLTRIAMDQYNQMRFWVQSINRF